MAARWLKIGGFEPAGTAAARAAAPNATPDTRMGRTLTALDTLDAIGAAEEGRAGGGGWADATPDARRRAEAAALGELE